MPLALLILTAALLGADGDRPEAGAVAPEEGAALGVPSIAELQKAAAESVAVSLGEARSLRRRARLAAWLPELSAGARRDLGEVDTLGLFSGTGVDTHNVDNMAHYDLRATWRLPELVFARQELQAAQAATEAQRAQDERVSRVTDLYYEWRRLLIVRSLAPPSDRAALLRLDLDLEERRARIDALTSGWLSRRLRRSRGRR